MPQPGPIRIFDLNMVAGVVLDQEHGRRALVHHMLFERQRHVQRRQFGSGPSGTTSAWWC
jgi:hypothetical protein